MSTSAMSRAVRRGIRRGLYLGATGDTSRLKKMRKEIESRDYVAEAWNEVGEAMYQAMGQTSPRSSRNQKPEHQ